RRRPHAVGTRDDRRNRAASGEKGGGKDHRLSLPSRRSAVHVPLRKRARRIARAFVQRATLGTLPPRASEMKWATSASHVACRTATRWPSYPLGPYSRTTAVTDFAETVRFPETGTASSVKPPIGSAGAALGAAAASPRPAASTYAACVAGGAYVSL